MDDLNSDIIINQRQKKILIELVRLMKKILIEQKNKTNTELIAENIRGALNLIGEITGEVAPEDILNGIFSTFCIGK
jgi:tRNA modification GTPase